MGLKEILKVSDDGSSFSAWNTQVISALESFLANVKVTLQQQQLPLSPIVVSYSNDTHSKSIQKTAELLDYIFTQMGMPVTLCALEDAAKLSAQLNNAEYAVVLGTPEYAAKVGKGSAIWNVLDKFGKKKKNAFHPLLCEGEFRDVALQIVDGHYLIRSVHAVLHQDSLVALLALVDILFHLSGSQGLGLLPDVLNLKEIVNAKAEMLYRDVFNQLQISIQKHTIDYRLKASVEESVQHHSLKTHNERPQINALVEGFLPSEAKVGLFFCHNKADTLLASLHLSEIFSKNDARVLTIDCAKYPGQASWGCVQKALKALQLKSADIEAMKQAPLIILLNGYQDLGAYDNLSVKNALSTWTNVKLLVTCQADYFKERGYLRCFLADVSNRRVEDIAVYSVPTFASLEAQMAALSINITPDVNQEAEQFPISDKRKAEYVELTRFLEHIHQLWVEKDYLKSALHQNPKLFISYAWEEDKTEAGKKALARQQMYLSRIAQDFKTIGIPTWLDREQMSGNIDEQMEKNIAESRGVLVIETPRYIERSHQATNVKKEWDAIYAKSQDQRDFRVFPLQYSSYVTQGNQTLSLNERLFINRFLDNHPNRCDFTNVDEDYVLRMTHPESGLITRWLCDTPEKKVLYQNAYSAFQQALQLLVGKHLIVNQGQADVLAFDMNNRLKGYIASFGLISEESPMESRFDLVKYFEQFLSNTERKTAIVLGRAGSGKSSFALSTFRQLLQPWITYLSAHQEKPRWLPIYIQLRNYAQQPEHAIQNALKQQFRLTDADIQALKQGLNHQQQILCILDGYDELGSGIRPNYTEMLKDWPQAKLLITSRPEHFDKNHRSLETLALRAVDGKVMYNSVQEAHVSPFSPNEIEQYIQQYEQGKSTNTYQTLKDLPGMMALLDNPFLLTLVLQSLPQLLANRQQSADRAIVRVDIYDAFTQTWFLQETRGRALNPDDCNAFCQSLAYRLFSEKTMNVSLAQNSKVIEDFFFHQPNRAVQDAAPMRFSGSGYSFIHKSLYEYFVAKRFWRAILEPDWLSIWQTRMLTEEQPIIDFLAEIFQSKHSAEKERKLFEMITASTNSDFPAMASSNAITVLNAARVSFSAKDLHGIRIPGADLHGALCDNTNLVNADLTNVNLTGAWLHNTNFNGALMPGVQLGEYPTICSKDGIQSCAYSPDGRLLAIGTLDMQIHLFDAQTRALLCTLEGHASWVESVSFSPDGQLLASGSDDKTVKLWQVETGALLRTFAIPARDASVSFSPDGQRLASSGWGIFRLWDNLNDVTPHSVTTQVTSQIKSLCFGSQPQGTFLATGHEDHSVRVWQLMQVNNQPYFQLLWTTHQNSLLAQNSNIANVQGLSQDNTDLLTQRGANTNPWQQAIAEIPNAAVLSARAGKLKLFSQEGNNAVSDSSSSFNNNTQQRVLHEGQVRDEKNKKCSMM